MLRLSMLSLAGHVLGVPMATKNETSLEPIPPPTNSAIAWGAQTHQYTRLVYNRVPKTGSTTMKELFVRLAKRNGFNIHDDNDYQVCRRPLAISLELF